MATLEERVSALENTLEHDFAHPLRSMALKVDELSRDVREQGRGMREVKARLAMVDTRLAMVDTRLNGLDERLDSLSQEVREGFNQVIALLTKGDPGA